MGNEASSSSSEMSSKFKKKGEEIDSPPGKRTKKIV